MGPKQIFVRSKQIFVRSKQIFVGSKQIPVGSKQIPVGSKQIPVGSKQIFAGSKQIFVRSCEMFVRLIAARFKGSKGDGSTGSPQVKRKGVQRSGFRVFRLFILMAETRSVASLCVKRIISRSYTGEAQRDTEKKGSWFKGSMHFGRSKWGGSEGARGRGSDRVGSSMHFVRSIAARFNDLRSPVRLTRFYLQIIIYESVRQVQRFNALCAPARLTRFCQRIITYESVRRVQKF